MIRFIQQVVFVISLLLVVCSFGCSKEKESDAVAHNTTYDAQQQRLKEVDEAYAGTIKYGYTPPKATWGDSASFRYHGAKNIGRDVAVASGRFFGIVFFNLLMFVIPLSCSR